MKKKKKSFLILSILLFICINFNSFCQDITLEKQLIQEMNIFGRKMVISDIYGNLWGLESSAIKKISIDSLYIKPESKIIKVEYWNVNTILSDRISITSMKDIGCQILDIIGHDQLVRSGDVYPKYPDTKNGFIINPKNILVMNRIAKVIDSKNTEHVVAELTSNDAILVEDKNGLYFEFSQSLNSINQIQNSKDNFEIEFKESDSTGIVKGKLISIAQYYPKHNPLAKIEPLEFMGKTELGDFKISPGKIKKIFFLNPPARVYFNLRKISEKAIIKLTNGYSIRIKWFHRINIQYNNDWIPPKPYWGHDADIIINIGDINYNLKFDGTKKIEILPNGFAKILMSSGQIKQGKISLGGDLVFWAGYLIDNDLSVLIPPSKLSSVEFIE